MLSLRTCESEKLESENLSKPAQISDSKNNYFVYLLKIYSIATVKTRIKQQLIPDIVIEFMVILEKPCLLE